MSKTIFFRNLCILLLFGSDSEVQKEQIKENEKYEIHKLLKIIAPLYFLWPLLDVFKIAIIILAILTIVLDFLVQGLVSYAQDLSILFYLFVTECVNVVK